MVEANGVALAFDRASVEYGPHRAVQEVSIQFRRGELVALAGPNGSGKSTLLRAGLGLLPLATGQAQLGGKPVGSLSIMERARMAAWMPQDEPVGDNIPLVDYVDYGRHPHRDWTHPMTTEERERVAQAIEMAGLWDLRQRRIWELSGGERQRARLARALVQDTPLLALDEPTAHLDIGHQLELLDLVRTIAHRDGRAVIVAIHDLNLAARFADRVSVLSRGRLVADGPPAAVLAPRLLREVWGVVAELKRDGRTGTPYLVPALPFDPTMETPERALRPGPVHVVGGGGSAAPLLRMFADQGYEVSVGVVPLFDTDEEVAQELHFSTVVEIPFAPLSEPVRAQNRALMRASRLVVVAPFPVGPGNLSNLEDVATLADSVPILLIEAPTGPSRDFTGGQAQRILDRLRELGATSAPSLEAALAAVTSRLGSPVPGSKSGRGPAVVEVPNVH